MERNLKLIAVTPPEPLFSEIRKEQEYIESTWGPKRALRTPPHLTIIPPMLLSSEEVGWLYGIAYAIAESQEPFKIQLKDYGSFKPRVIFISPKSNSSLSDLQELWHQSIITRMPHVLAKYPDRPFQPHITMAHKDVTHDQFDSMWKHYNEQIYQTTFDVNRFCILSHAETGWFIEKEYLFALHS